MFVNVMMSLLKLVRPKKPQPPAAPPPPSPAPLPGKLFAELVGLEAMRNRRLDDRRRRPRLDHAGTLSILAEMPTGPAEIGARVHDMSAEGLSFDAPVPLPLGTKFSAKMNRVVGEGSVELTYGVRRCDAQPDGRWFVGSELLHYRE
jgi:hypothetical protein